ncbi:MAG: complex I NDUFA9 subunit family protein [Verrucomicrobia bacterium]|nr:MAG: complex I NDUFA9 subunit family protein [Verrucomicrobiota bacterium]
MRVLVTGGAGFVGRAVVAALLEEGHEAVVLARRPDTPAARTLAARDGVRVVAGDILDPASLPSALESADAVVHLVGIISECGRQTFDRVHRLGTQHLLQAVRQTGRIRRFIHISALGTRPDAPSRYHQSKWAAEQAVRASGLDWTIFRPSLIFGPGDQFVNRFARMSRWSPILPIPGSGRGTMQPVAVEVVAAAFARALTEPRAIGRTFDLVGPEEMTLAQILDHILAACGRRRWKLRIPGPLARIQAAILEWLWPRLLKRPAPLNRDQLLMLEERNTGDPRPAIELFGLPVIRFAQGLRQMFPPAGTNAP